MLACQGAHFEGGRSGEEPAVTAGKARARRPFVSPGPFRFGARRERWAGATSPLERRLLPLRVSLAPRHLLLRLGEACLALAVCVVAAPLVAFVPAVLPGVRRSRGLRHRRDRECAPGLQ